MAGSSHWLRKRRPVPSGTREWIYCHSKLRSDLFLLNSLKRVALKNSQVNDIERDLREAERLRSLIRPWPFWPWQCHVLHLSLPDPDLY